MRLFLAVLSHLDTRKLISRVTEERFVESCTRMCEMQEEERRSLVGAVWVASDCEILFLLGYARNRRKTNLYASTLGIIER